MIPLPARPETHTRGRTASRPARGPAGQLGFPPERGYFGARREAPDSPRDRPITGERHTRTHLSQDRPEGRTGRTDPTPRDATTPQEVTETPQQVNS
ncbi:hypothetical protein FRAHR75_40045 [Frankia sp. Hr75.2]|nr:hypothetical protein FRAHR75_40045 [Frankia sp. Hr75.2]